MSNQPLEPGIYELKKELGSILNIPINQLNNRRTELYEWFKNFFDYEVLDGRPVRIYIKEIYNEYRPLPRKTYDMETRLADVLAAEKDYADFTIQSLSTKDYEPNSKMRIAREAMHSFGMRKYHHSGYTYVANRFIKQPFDENADSNGKQVWVYYSSYKPIEEKRLTEWLQILKEEKIDEKEAAKAFYKMAQGQNVEKEKSYYQKAVDRFKRQYNDYPILVSCYKLKEESAF